MLKVPRSALQVYGVLLFAEGRQAKAREVLRQGVSYNPANPQVGAHAAWLEHQRVFALRRSNLL